MDNRLACMYYPTTTMLVDDNSRFLDHVSLTLGADLPHTAYTDPTQALAALQKSSSAATRFSQTIVTDQASNDYRAFSEKHPLSLNLAKLYETVYQRNRFAQVSVAVVDYAMPQMNGLEFCRRLTGTQIKKIMLTGEADEAVAVEAFNQGLIDKFIIKNKADVDKTLIASIHELQKRNFQDLSAMLIQGLSTQPNSCLIDPVFVSFFNELVKSLSASDYYLIEASGSFLFMDQNGTLTWLVVRNEEDLQDFAIEADEADAPEQIIEAIKSGMKIPYFNDLSDYSSETPQSEWEKILYPAHKLAGSDNKNYYYSILKGLPNFSFEPSKVVSLKEYRKECAAQGANPKR